MPLTSLPRSRNVFQRARNRSGTRRLLVKHASRLEDDAAWETCFTSYTRPARVDVPVFFRFRLAASCTGKKPHKRHRIHRGQCERCESEHRGKIARQHARQITEGHGRGEARAGSQRLDARCLLGPKDHERIPGRLASVRLRTEDERFAAHGLCMEGTYVYHVSIIHDLICTACGQPTSSVSASPRPRLSMRSARRMYAFTCREQGDILLLVGHILGQWAGFDDFPGASNAMSISPEHLRHAPVLCRLVPSRATMRGGARTRQARTTCANQLISPCTAYKSRCDRPEPWRATIESDVGTREAAHTAGFVLPVVSRSPFPF